MTATSTPAPKSPRPIDPLLLARMTGQLGDRQTTEARASALAGALCEPIEAALARLGIAEAAIQRGDIRLALRADLEKGFKPTDVACEGAIAGWCSDIAIVAPATFVIGFVEALLGGDPAAVAAKRAPSDIERHTSVVLFEQVVDALKQTVAAPSAIATTGEPQLRANLATEEGAANAHCALISLDVSIGTLSGRLTLLVPQSVLVKTIIAASKPTEAASTAAARPQWAQRLERQISRADVTLRAHVDLEPMTLGALAALKPGDVLPFADAQDVRVKLEANGRTIRVCELGRTGNRFMVRLKAPENLDDAVTNGRGR